MHQYQVRSGTNSIGLEKSDIDQEINMAILEALNNYKINSKAAFSSFAYYYIKHAVYKAVRHQVNIVTVPKTVMENYYKMQRILQSYRVEGKSLPNPVTLQQIMGVDDKTFLLVYCYRSAAKNSYTDNLEDSQLSSEEIVIYKQVIKLISKYLTPKELEVFQLYTELGPKSQTLYSTLATYTDMDPKTIQKTVHKIKKVIQSISEIDQLYGFRTDIKSDVKH